MKKIIYWPAAMLYATADLDEERCKPHYDSCIYYSKYASSVHDHLIRKWRKRFEPF